MTKQKILVLGGSYFIGKGFVESLIDSNYEVYLLNRGTRQNDCDFVNQIICDRNDKTAMQNALKDFCFDYVVDFSCFTAMQARILIDALNISAVKQFLFISSSAVYDLDNQKAPFKETDKLAKNSYWQHYGSDKIECELLLKEYLQSTNTPLRILRPSYVYGPNNYAYRENFVFDRILNNRPIIVPQNGETKIQFIYVNDIAKILLKLIKSKNNELCQIYNVSYPQAITFNEWIGYCEQTVRQKATKLYYNDFVNDNINVKRFFPFHTYDNVLDVSPLLGLGIKLTDIKYGLDLTFTWYQKNKDNIARKQEMFETENCLFKNKFKLSQFLQ